MIKTIFFDIGNVLVDVSTDRVVDRLLKFGLEKSQIEINSLFNDFGAFGLYERGYLSSYDFYIEILNRTNIKMPYNEFISAWCDMFSPKPRVFNLLKRLRDNYKLGLLSNTNALHINYLKDNYDFFSMIDYECYSFELHSVKPEKTIYQNAIFITGNFPEQVLFIDDKRENVSGAKETGIKSLQFESYEKLEKDLSALDVII